MAAQPFPILEIDADFGSPHGEVTGVFHFRKATVEEVTRTGKLVSNQFSNLLGALEQLGVLPEGGDGREGITIDAGGGQHVFEIDLVGIGAEDGQWGRTNDPDVLDQTSATGGDRIQKMNVLHRYINLGRTDSFHPARLIYGEYASGGIMPQDHLDVAIEDPNVVANREESSTFDSSITLVGIASLDEAIDVSADEVL